MNKLTNEQKFERWMVQSLDALRKLPNGDGAFAALGMACGSYERYVDSILNREKKTATPDEVMKRAASLLGCSQEEMERFWNGYRLGMQHAFSPKSYVEKKGLGDKWGWEISEGADFGVAPTKVQLGAKHFIIRIDPWKFAYFVVELWRKDPSLHDELSEYPFGNVYSS